MLFGAALTVSAQTDVTAHYLKNYGFDSGFHHAAGETTEVKQEIKTITGWTAGFTVDYTIAGIYEYGFAGTFNGGEVPAQGYQGSKGGALALSTGWDVEMTYSQTVTLPAGAYTITAPTYNGKSATKGHSLLAWIPQILPISSLVIFGVDLTICMILSSVRKTGVATGVATGVVLLSILSHIKHIEVVLFNNQSKRLTKSFFISSSISRYRAKALLPSL